MDHRILRRATLPGGAVTTSSSTASGSRVHRLRPKRRSACWANRGVFDTPFSASGYTDQLIRDQQARSLADMVANDPSVRLATSRYSERANFVIRGFQTYTTLFNGLPGLVDSRLPFLDGIERVDVFKSPSTLINGASQDVGDTINFVPKRAEAGGTRRVTLGYVGDAQGELHLDLGDRWGDDGRWGLRGNVGLRYGETPLDNQLERAGIGVLAFDYGGARRAADARGSRAARLHDRAALLPPVRSRIRSLPLHRALHPGRQERGRSHDPLVRRRRRHLVRFAAPVAGSAADRTTSWFEMLHMAEVFGLPYRIFVSALGLAVAVAGLSVTGILIWTKKRSARLLGKRRAPPSRERPRDVVGITR